jgi:putative transposase
MRKTWSIEEKVSILKEAETNGIVETCRKHGIYSTTFYDWKRKFEKGGPEGLRPNYSKRESADYRRLEKENDLLKKLLAEKELEIGVKTELLKKKMEQWRNAKR